MSKFGRFSRALFLCLLACFTLLGTKGLAAPPYDIVYGDQPPDSFVFGIYGINFDGSNRTQIFSHPSDGASNPALSPDGRVIVFQRQISSKTSLWLINSDGSGLRRLTGDDEAILPAWSRDGRRVAFSSRRGENNDIYVIDIQAGTEVRLTDHPAVDTAPAWSPDGTRLAFVSFQEGGDAAEIFVMNADGSEKRRLTNNPRHEFWPRWGPHGRIAFSRQKSGGGTLNGPSELWVINPDGSGETQITFTAAEVKNSYPAWTLDGRRLIFTSNDSSTFDPIRIVIANADGSDPRSIYSSTGRGQTIFAGLSARQPARVVYSDFEEMVPVEQLIPEASTHFQSVRMNAAQYVVGTRLVYNSARGVTSQQAFVYHQGRVLVLPLPAEVTRVNGTNISDVRSDGSMLVLGQATFNNGFERGVFYRITTALDGNSVTTRVLPNYIYPSGNAYAGESSRSVAQFFGPGDVIYGTEAGPGLPKPLRWSPPDYSFAVDMEGAPGDEYSTNVAADGGDILQKGYDARGSWINHSIQVPGTADRAGAAVDLRNGFIVGTRDQAQEPRTIGFVWRTEWPNLLEFPNFRSEAVNAQGHFFGIVPGRTIVQEGDLVWDILIRGESGYSRARAQDLLAVRPKFRSQSSVRHYLRDLSDSNQLLEQVELDGTSGRHGFLINANANGPGTPAIQVSDRLLAFVGEQMTFQFSADAGAELNAIALDRATLDTLAVDRASGTVSFTPTGGTTEGILLVARNERGYAARNVNIVVRRRESSLPAPAPGDVRTTIGSAVFLDVSSRESYSYRATGLPPGLRIREFGDGYIEGVPTTPGTYRVTVFVTNNVGTSSASFTIHVDAAPQTAPAVNSPARALAQLDVPFSYSVTTAAFAESIEVTGLPVGLFYDHAIRQIVGTPPSQGFFGGATPGTYPVKIRTENSAGSAEFDLTLELLPARAADARAFGETVPVASFNIGNGAAGGGVFSIEIQADGKLLLVGDFSSFNNQSLQRILRLNADGSVDTSFQAGSILGRITAVRLLPDGKILVGGEFNFGGDSPTRALARLLPDGSPDTSFLSDLGVNAQIETIQLLPDGRIVIGGSTGGASTTATERKFKAATAGSGAFLRVLHPDGRNDTSFNAALPANGAIHAVLPLGDGSILVGGSFDSGSGLVKLDGTGARDGSFAANVAGEVYALANARDGSVFVGGLFSSVSGEARANLAHIQTNGALLPGFGATAPIIGGAVNALAPDRLGGLFIGGSFSGVGDLGRAGFARLNADGSVDQQYAVAAGPNESVEALRIDASGNLVIGGTFTELGRTPRSGVARLVGNAVANLANISTRLRVESGENVLIGGFIVQGSLTKRLIIRAIGPSLTASGAPLPGRLNDPALTLFASDGTQLARNDNWRDTQQQAVIDSTIPPQDERESAIVVDLAPGAYTAIVSGANGEQGVGLVEAYDLQQSAPSRMVNISTRGRVQAGESVMIGGYIVLGERNKTVLIRAIGPSLGAAGVAGSLQDPELLLVDGNGSAVGGNNDWQQGDQAQAIAATGAAPSDGREAALIANLAPGAYTAVVRGVNGTTGVGLVEVYELD